MRITVDNEDGLGAVDYSAAVTAEGPITVQRQLNAPSRCTAEIMLGLGGRATPVRRGRVVVTSDAGTVLFTGYLATEPVAVYAGEGTTGPVYRARLSAISDEWLLDRQGSGGSETVDGVALALSGTALLAQMAERAQAGSGGAAGAAPIVVAGASGNVRSTGAFAVAPAATWSSNAGAAAAGSYAAYRVVNGSVVLQPAATVTHVLGDGNGALGMSLSLAEFSLGHVRELANDVTVSGAEEPVAYVQEIFTGDGSTDVFSLRESAFRGSHRTLVRDGFTGASFDVSQWTLSAAGGHLSLGGAGLVLNGGNGYDGQTTLTAVNAVEIGGFVLAELGGVVFGAGSDGMLAGFYASAQTVLANCFAGFRVRQSVSATGSSTVLVPVVNGAEAGTVFTPTAGHSYTLRLRLYCAEVLRLPQVYYAMADGVVEQFGGGAAVDAAMRLVFDLVDEGVSSNTYATVLYDTAATGTRVTGAPATCVFVAANSTNLVGSVGSIAVTRPGSVWLESTLPNGAVATRLVGLAGQGVDCEVLYGSEAGSPGKVTFFAGRIPVAGERITVSYRNQGRAVARLADAASVAAEAAAGAGVSVGGVSRWLGKVLQPVARSSGDCEAAAQALLAMTTARAASLAGTCAMVNPAVDIWPGDLLQVVSNGAMTPLLVRGVTASDAHCLPEVMRYQVQFANGWSTELEDGLGVRVSESIAIDAVLPATAVDAPAQVLASLPELVVRSLSDTVLQVSTTVTAPSGGGFEVRRRDWSFGAVGGADLVLRSPVANFAIPRAAQVECFYVRMYDGSTPPLYSRWSSALFVHAPVS